MLPIEYSQGIPIPIGLKDDQIDMKIVINPRHISDKSYLVVFSRDKISKDSIRKLIEKNDDVSARRLLVHSDRWHKLLPSQKRRAEAAADFIVSPRGYSVERLA